MTAVAAPVAGAADYYVDRDVAVSNPLCLIASPCKTIAESYTAAQANPGPDTIHVGHSSAAYAGTTVPDDPLTLIGDDYDFTGSGTTTVIDGNMSPGVTIAGGAGARTIDGFTIEGADTAGFAFSLDNNGVADALTVANNFFDETSAQLDGFIALQGSPIIRNNVIQGSGQVFGIQLTGAVTAQITGNNASGTERVIDVEGSGTIGTQNVIDDNTIQVRGLALPPAAGIFLLAATGDVRGNTVTMDPTTTLNQTDGLYAANNDTNGTLRLARNTFAGFDKPGAKGVETVSPDPLTMSDDVIAGNNFGVVDNGNGSPNNLSLTNETIWENLAADVRLATNPTEVVTVDSSIIGDTGIVDTAGSSCTSSFSRGPASVPFCGPYATNANPSFVGGSDLHLTPAGNGPFIDMGNTTAPLAGELDRDGNSRAIAIIACPARRDVGAYELNVNPLDCNPPAESPAVAAPPSSVGTPPVTTRKKCKRKRHRTAAAAKKRCKKRKR